MIQLYAKLSDLKPTESYEVVSSIGEYRDWQWSIILDGIKFMLHVDCEGNIPDGNGRYYILKGSRQTYAPISWQFFTGLQYNTNVPPTDKPYYDIDPRIKEYVTNRAYTEMKEIVR